MAVISFDEREIVVTVNGLDTLLAFRHTLRVPIGHIEKVRAHPPEARFDDSVLESSRGVGTYVRGKFAVGTVRLVDCVAFFAVHDPKRAIAIDLRVGKMVAFEADAVTRIVVELDDETPEACAERITRAIESGRITP